MTTNFSNQQVKISSFAAKVDLELAQSLFAKQFITQRYRDALHIDMPKGMAFVFDYGILICWGISDAKREALQQTLNQITHSATVTQMESYTFTLPPSQGEHVMVSTMSNDLLALSCTKVMTLLALSHGFAQACKLEWFEAKAAGSIIDNQKLTHTLATRGKIGVSRKQLAKARGTLFEVKSDIMLNFNLLDTPEFFWDHPVMEADYLSICKYLELKPRIELLNLKLQTIHELLEMLAAEQNHKHSSFLEWIIILLIAVEIVLFFAH